MELLVPVPDHIDDLVEFLLQGSELVGLQGAGADRDDERGIVDRREVVYLLDELEDLVEAVLDHQVLEAVQYDGGLGIVLDEGRVQPHHLELQPVRVYRLLVRDRCIREPYDLGLGHVMLLLQLVRERRGYREPGGAALHQGHEHAERGCMVVVDYEVVVAAVDLLQYRVAGAAFHEKQVRALLHAVRFVACRTFDVCLGRTHRDYLHEGVAAFRAVLRDLGAFLVIKLAAFALQQVHVIRDWLLAHRAGRAGRLLLGRGLGLGLLDHDAHAGRCARDRLGRNASHWLSLRRCELFLVELLELLVIEHLGKDAEHDNEDYRKQPYHYAPEEYVRGNEAEKRGEEVEDYEQQYGQLGRDMQPCDLQGLVPELPRVGELVVGVHARGHRGYEVGADEDHGEKHLGVLQEAEGLECGHVVYRLVVVEGDAVCDNLAGRGPDYLDAPGVYVQALEVAHVHSVVGVLVLVGVEFPVYLGHCCIIQARMVQGVKKRVCHQAEIEVGHVRIVGVEVQQYADRGEIVPGDIGDRCESGSVDGDVLLVVVHGVVSIGLSPEEDQIEVLQVFFHVADVAALPVEPQFPVVDCTRR